MEPVVLHARSVAQRRLNGRQPWSDRCHSHHNTRSHPATPCCAGGATARADSKGLHKGMSGGFHPLVPTRSHRNLALGLSPCQSDACIKVVSRGLWLHSSCLIVLVCLLEDGSTATGRRVWIEASGERPRSRQDRIHRNFEACQWLDTGPCGSRIGSDRCQRLGCADQRRSPDRHAAS